MFNYPGEYFQLPWGVFSSTLGSIFNCKKTLDSGIPSFGICLDGSLTFEGAKTTNSVSSRREAIFFRKVAFRPDVRRLLEHWRGSRGSRGNDVIYCGSDPPNSRAGGQDDGSYTNSLKTLPFFHEGFLLS